MCSLDGLLELDRPCPVFQRLVMEGDPATSLEAAGAKYPFSNLVSFRYARDSIPFHTSLQALATSGQVQG